jgi:nucleotidyltransferase/DNA polymerase involved in DNA repair
MIEPPSLDEVYLDVSHLQSRGAAVTREIRAQIAEETLLTLL